MDELKKIFIPAKAFIAWVSKCNGCPRCGAPLTAAGNCSQLCGGA